MVVTTLVENEYHCVLCENTLKHDMKYDTALTM